MFSRTKAALAVLWSGGRVPVPEKIDCPYCGATNSNYTGFKTDNRPRLSIWGNLACRKCGHSLHDDECDACGIDFNGGSE